MLKARKKTWLLIYDVRAVALLDINKRKVRSLPSYNYVLSKATNEIIVVPRIPKKDSQNFVGRLR
jgi:hypothetical protein